MKLGDIAFAAMLIIGMIFFIFGIYFFLALYLYQLNMPLILGLFFIISALYIRFRKRPQSHLQKKEIEVIKYKKGATGMVLVGGIVATLLPIFIILGGTSYLSYALISGSLLIIGLILSPLIILAGIGMALSKTKQGFFRWSIVALVLTVISSGTGYGVFISFMGSIVGIIGNRK